MWILSAHAVYASISCTMNGRVQQPLLVQAKAGGLQQTLAACQEELQSSQDTAQALQVHSLPPYLWEFQAGS